jgi:hypothetical protein
MPREHRLRLLLAKDELVAVNEDQQTHAHNQDNGGDPELNVRQDGP